MEKAVEPIGNTYPLEIILHPLINSNLDESYRDMLFGCIFERLNEIGSNRFRLSVESGRYYVSFLARNISISERQIKKEAFEDFRHFVYSITPSSMMDLLSPEVVRRYQNQKVLEFFCGLKSAVCLDFWMLEVFHALKCVVCQTLRHQKN